MRQIIFLFLTITFRGIAQTTELTLQNVNWTLLHILDKEKNVVYKCRGNLIFHSDSTFSGFDGCNTMYSGHAGGPLSLNESAICRYYIKKPNLLTISDRIMATQRGCITKGGFDELALFRKSFQKTYMYKITSDTLILYCKNNVDLYYIREPFYKKIR
ncbi:MAG: META domain-containing protein [Bacteroidia bacterium]